MTEKRSLNQPISLIVFCRLWRPSRVCFLSITFSTWIRHSDLGCDEPGQPSSSDAAAGGRRDDVKQVTDAAASGHPRHDCGWGHTHTHTYFIPDYAELNLTLWDLGANSLQLFRRTLHYSNPTAIKSALMKLHFSLKPQGVLSNLD